MYTTEDKINLEVNFVNLFECFTEILRIAFYIFNITPRANTTYGLCKICFLILDYIEQSVSNQDNEIKKVIEIQEKEVCQLIFTELLLFIENFDNKNAYSIESLDIFWILKKLYKIDGSFLLPYSRFKDFFQLENKDKKQSYFEIMTILFYIGDVDELNTPMKSEIEKYVALKNIELPKSISNKLNNTSFLNDTETFLLFFDSLSCPYMNDETKCNILRNTKHFIKCKNNELKEMINEIQQNDWFFSWNLKFEVKTLFEFKELHKSY